MGAYSVYTAKHLLNVLYNIAEKAISEYLPDNDSYLRLSN
jgi:hypothetical protein